MRTSIRLTNIINWIFITKIQRSRVCPSGASENRLVTLIHTTSASHVPVRALNGSFCFFAVTATNTNVAAAASCANEKPRAKPYVMVCGVITESQAQR
ncbi:MAG: hypothetical protein IPI08_13695 [Betaproteobacteria bacterium]|nr:hypothetical protein [Betaproteobacteria bacterium]